MSEGFIEPSEDDIKKIVTAIEERVRPVIDNARDRFYDSILETVERYLVENSAHNIWSELDRCRRIKAENEKLAKAVSDLKSSLRDMIAVSEYHKDFGQFYLRAKALIQKLESEKS